jgi:hypothetical protein
MSAPISANSSDPGGDKKRAALAKTEARRRGGRARHARNDCACRRAARLIRVMAPAGGWTSAAQAARLIEPKLVVFIKGRRLSLVCEQSLRRTIVRWINNRPVVRAAFDKCRAARRKLPW